jgi:LSD1 subclass zinc finger protein
MMPCEACAALLNVPEGATRFRCPLCAAVNEHGAAPPTAAGRQEEEEKEQQHDEGQEEEDEEEH